MFQGLMTLSSFFGSIFHRYKERDLISPYCRALRFIKFTLHLGIFYSFMILSQNNDVGFIVCYTVLWKTKQTGYMWKKVFLSGLGHELTYTLCRKKS